MFATDTPEFALCVCTLLCSNRMDRWLVDFRHAAAVGTGLLQSLCKAEWLAPHLAACGGVVACAGSFMVDVLDVVVDKTAGIVPSGIRKSLPTNQEYFYLRVSNCRALVGRLHRLRRRMVLARGRSVLLNSLCACTASQCASRHSTRTSFLRVAMQGL